MKWIKIRTDIHSHPKIIEMARRMEYLTGADEESSITLRRVNRNNWRHFVVGCLCLVWSVFGTTGKREGDNLIIKNATLKTIDDLVMMDGFGESMEAVGWVFLSDDDDDNSLIFKNFYSEYNTDIEADLRAKNAERQKRYRAKNKGVTNNGDVALSENVTVTSHRNIDKRREDKNIYNARECLIELGLQPKLIDEWLSIRKAKKLLPTESAINATIREAEKAGLTLEQAIQTCCDRSWGGFRAEYLEKPVQQPNTEKPQHKADDLL